MIHNVLPPVVAAMGKIDFTGHVVPHTWFHHAKLKNGKLTNLVAIHVLSDIVYWYRPKVEIDEITGAQVATRKRFAGNRAYFEYDLWCERLGITKRQLQEAVAFLARQGIITTEFCNLYRFPNGGKKFNIVFVEPVVPVIAELNDISQLPVKMQREGIPEKWDGGHDANDHVEDGDDLSDGSQNNVIPSPEKREPVPEKTEKGHTEKRERGHVKPCANTKIPAETPTKTTSKNTATVQAPVASPKSMSEATPAVVSSRIFVSNSDDALDLDDDDTEEYDDEADADANTEAVRAAITGSLATVNASGGRTSDETDGLIARLIAKGISADRADDLVGDFPGRVHEQLEYLPYADNVRGEAGYLIRAIEGNYSPPARWVAKQEAVERRNREREQTAAAKRIADEKKAVAERLTAQCDALWNEMSDAERHIVEEKVTDELGQNHAIRPHLGGQTGKFVDLIASLARTARYKILAEMLKAKP